MGVYKRKLASISGVFLVTIASIMIIVIGDIWYISVLTAVVGLFLGFIHGVGMKIMLEYGTANNTGKYSTINEIVIGIGFGITPIVSGYIVEYEIFGIYWIIMIFGVIATVTLIFLSRNVKRKQVK
jgi:MFS family permease